MLLVNAVMAILLDEFLSAAAASKQAQAREAFGEARVEAMKTPLDPLLARLALCDSYAKLREELDFIFDHLDTDGHTATARPAAPRPAAAGGAD